MSTHNDPITRVQWVDRYTVSDDARLRQRYNGQVPVVVVDADPVHRQMSTIRHNRARGTHGVLPMAEIVRGMVEAGVERDDIIDRLQMEAEEVDRLLDRAGMPASAGSGFGQAWRPTKEGKA